MTPCCVTYSQTVSGAASPLPQTPPPESQPALHRMLTLRPSPRGWLVALFPQLVLCAAGRLVTSGLQHTEQSATFTVPLSRAVFLCQQLVSHLPPDLGRNLPQGLCR